MCTSATNTPIATNKNYQVDKATSSVLIVQNDIPNFMSTQLSTVSSIHKNIVPIATPLEKVSIKKAYSSDENA